MSRLGTRIVFDEELHAAGERTPVQSFAMAQALAWWVGAELVRRHPGRVLFQEGFVHQYGRALIVHRRSSGDPRAWELLAYLTFAPGMHITPSSWFRTGEERFTWLEVLLATDRREYVVRQLEAAEGLPSPAQTPATTSWSVGPRLIGAFLGRTALGPDKWIVTNGAWSDDEDEGVNEEFFEQIPGADEARRVAGTQGVPQEPESRFWFLQPVKGGEPRDPVMAVDGLAGVAWGPRGRVDLLKRYRALGSRIDALVSDVMPPTH